MSLLDQYRILHSQGKFLGLSVIKFADEIGELCKQYGAETMLDYGAGAGHQYLPPHSLDKKWGVSVQCYDPAVSGMDFVPEGKFDAVICSDVLEHVPLAELDDLIEKVFARATKFVFFTVCCRGAKKTLPNGQNAHVTIMPMLWWSEKIAEAARARSNPPMPVWLRETP